MDEFRSVISRLVPLLSRLSLNYHLTGGLASSYYGEPRFTQDIDVVIRLAPGSEQVKKLLAALSPQFIIDEEAVISAVNQGGLFQALDQETMIKVDFHVGEGIPGELRRSREVEILPGISAQLVSKEDAILSKLVWIQKGSHKSRQDAIMMLRAPGEIDAGYLQEQAAALSLAGLLKELQSEAAQSPHQVTD